MDLQFEKYVRAPFVVEVVEITEDNIEQIAPYVGEIREKDDGEKYIVVDKRLVPTMNKVFVGFFMTRMGENIRCYAPRVFHQQFVKETEDIAHWVEHMDTLTAKSD